MHPKVVIIGGGAAGFFGAIVLAEALPGSSIIILEQGKQVLEKVRISGGGRCNVTNACEDPLELILHYPRGQKELLGPFYHFGPAQMKTWLYEHGVGLKTEEDGRVFPSSDRSETIITCFLGHCRTNGIDIRTSSKVIGIEATPDNPSPFSIITRQEVYKADALLIATGSNPSIWRMLEKLGHKIVPPVPSLFTFQVNEARLRALAGVQVSHAQVTIPSHRLEAEGPVLITHWGLSGPAILRLSAWGARQLHEMNYQFDLQINWNPGWQLDDVRNLARTDGKRQVKNTPVPSIPRRLWHMLLEDFSGFESTWSDCSFRDLEAIHQRITKSIWWVNGKSTNKDEFVTAGGVELKEIDFKSFRSRRIPGLYLAGEVLNIDALTGGYNFQAAWTGAYLAAQDIATKFS